MFNTIEKLFIQLLEKHGVDRYQWPYLAVIKIQEEVGELAQVYLKYNLGDLSQKEKIRQELADVIFAVQGMARYFDCDLIREMEATIRRAQSK